MAFYSQKNNIQTLQFQYQFFFFFFFFFFYELYVNRQLRYSICMSVILICIAFKGQSDLDLLLSSKATIHVTGEHGPLY